jgi:hypothetical protein
MPDGMFMGLLGTVLVTNIGGWWKFVSAKPSLDSRRAICSLIGLIASSATIVLPIVYAVAHPEFDWKYVLAACFLLSVLAIFMAAFGMSQVRLLLIMASVAIGLVLISIPIGIL